MKFKAHIMSQLERLKEEIRLPEYILWWVMRAMMVYAFIMTKHSGRPQMVWIMIGANLAVTFVISLFSLIFPKKLFFGRIPFRVQTYIDIFVIAGSFFGHYINIYRYEGVYDKALHVVSGFLTVFIGYELMKALLPKKELPKFWGAFGGFSFSFLVMILWEVFEFFSDFILGNANNQGYMQSFCNEVYTDGYFFFKIFGRGNGGAEQLPVLDTMIDIIAAVVGAVIALVIFLIFVKEKKETAAMECEEEKETETV